MNLTKANVKNINVKRQATLNAAQMAPANEQLAIQQLAKIDEIKKNIALLVQQSQTIVSNAT